MDRDFWISELGRLYERSTEAINENQSAAVKPLSDEFNDILSKLKDKFPEDQIVSSTDKVHPYTNSGFKPERARVGALHEIRSRCEKMAYAIGYELPELESGPRSPNRMVMVSVDSRQEAIQEVSQEVTIEQIQQMVQTLPRERQVKEELQELIEEFENEVHKGQNRSKLRNILSKANEISTEVAAQMAVFALKRGLTGILGL